MVEDSELRKEAESLGNAVPQVAELVGRRLSKRRVTEMPRDVRQPPRHATWRIRLGRGR